MATVINKNSNKKNRKRIFYLDALRALAIITVIAVHLADKTWFLNTGKMVIGSLNWYVTDMLNFRLGVDLFLMLAGALSLGRDWDIKTFLGKRIPRIVGPFIFWGLILSVFLISCSYFFPDIVHVIKSFNLASISKYIIKAFLAKSLGFGPYWFFWMILGTYLIMPIFNKWLLHSDLKEAEYFLCFWIITTIFTFTLNREFPIALTYFTSPIGLVILGYYLRHTERKIFKSIYTPIILMLIGCISSLTVSYLLSSPSHIVTFGRYSIFMIIIVSGVFLLFRNLSNIDLNINFFSNPKGVFKRSVFSIAKYSYGIYLIHFPILTVMICFLRKCTDLNFKPIVLISFVGIILICWGIMALLNRVPYINRIIGAK